MGKASEEMNNVPWSFEPESLRKDLPEENDFEALLRGHLYIEHVLIHFLQEAMPKFDLLDVERVPFNIKVEVCAATGVLPEKLIGPIKRINSLRNRSAHNLHYRISDQDKRDLFNLFDDTSRLLASERGETTGRTYSAEEISIAHFIKVIVVMTDLGRQNYVKWKEKRAQAVENARRFLESVKAPEEPEE